MQEKQMRKNDRETRFVSASLLLSLLIFSVPWPADAGRQTTEDANAISMEDKGPVVYFNYGSETIQETPISSFLYFIPLVAMTAVERQAGAGCGQRVRMIACTRQKTQTSFFTTCEFEIAGDGYHRDIFDPEDMIAFYKEEIKAGQTLAHMLDYIHFEGQGYVRMEISGITGGSAETVTQVDVWFNGRGRKSPVTIGLYDVRPVEGKYRYENRSNQMVVRVNRLTFKRTEGQPTMGVRVATLGRSAEEEGLWPTVKGMIANLLIRPPRINPLGNETMLRFGATIHLQKPSFTLPKAEMIQNDRQKISSGALVGQESVCRLDNGN
jgi:hypothetical protein